MRRAGIDIGILARDSQTKVLRMAECGQPGCAWSAFCSSHGMGRIERKPELSDVMERVLDIGGGDRAQTEVINLGLSPWTSGPARALRLAPAGEATDRSYRSGTREPSDRE